MFKVKPKTLLIIAGTFWIMAGLNVLRIGIISFFQINKKNYLLFISSIIFFLFEIMFFKIKKKHIKRILKYKNNTYFWNFFDLKSYIIMIFMISLGIILRILNVFPVFFVAFFYTGLGLALTLEGIMFIKNYFSNINNI